MDILCTRCGEPWDVCSLVDDMTPEEAKSLKAGKGCPSCIGKEVCQRTEECKDCRLRQIGSYPTEGHCHANAFKPINRESSYIQQELATILGDDMDGLASTMEDFGLM